MNKHFYTRLAASNLKKNSRTYLPYILSSILTVSMFYIMVMISKTTFFGHESLGQILVLGDIVIAIFAVIFLFYTHSFLIKRRKMEFGLYNVLGMNKRQIVKLISLETLYTSLVSLVIGLGLGILLSKLMYLILENLINFKLQDQVTVSSEALVITLILFCGIFALTLLNSIRLIHLSKPIELLRGGQTGEKEPKTKWVLTIIGIASLAAGYYIAIAIQDPLEALLYFFVAVILVIIGTYCLFTAVSIFVLKMLRKNKTYYYKTSHFISISGMMYRMKQNAVGLANICILATIVLVTISTTVCLYTGMNDIMSTMYPHDISIKTGYSQANEEKIDDAVKNVLAKDDLKMSDKEVLKYVYETVDEKDGEFDYSAYSNASKYPQYDMVAIPEDDFDSITGDEVKLDDSEAIVFIKDKPYGEETINIQGLKFNVKPYSDSDRKDIKKIVRTYLGTETLPTMIVVVDDMDTVNELGSLDKHRDLSSPVRMNYGFDFSGTTKQQIAVSNELRQNQTLADDISEPAYLDCKADNIRDFNNTYGGLLFLGLYLGVLFLMATIMIIYYKQLSEGYDDKERFRIMQNVGLTKREVKKAIRSQILTMFFLPLVVACIHVCFAFPMISKLLKLFSMDNTALFLICTLICAAVFAGIYALVYVFTSRMYYRIVEAG